jgi:hypothetical protein
MRSAGGLNRASSGSILLPPLNVLAYNPSAGIPIPRGRNSPIFEATEENKDVNERTSKTIMPTRELNLAKFGEVR